MKNIDLLPPEYARREERRARLLGWGVVLSVAALFCAGASIWMATRLGNARVRIDRLSGEYRMMQRTQTGIEELKVQLATVVDRNQAILSLLGQRPWCDILADLSAKLHRRAWLSSLELSKEMTAPARLGALLKGDLTAVESLMLTGFAVSYLELSQLMSALNTSPYVSGVVLESSQAAVESGRPAVRFTIRLGLEPLGETG
ncbi:MAG: PilN domain-containing protein [Myxococcales bacterium]|nr:PilN domain-containing protein [Myxococcales bacterium]